MPTWWAPEGYGPRGCAARDLTLAYWRRKGCSESKARELVHRYGVKWHLLEATR